MLIFLINIIVIHKIMGRNVLLDCGTHFGQGLSEFIDRFNVNDTWVVHSFEANPVTYNINMTQKNPLYYVIYHNVAVHNKDEIIKINVETPPGEGETGMGSSVISLDKWNPWNGTLRENFKTYYDVPAINFSKFIINNFTKDDNIIIKMDIEGSEFNVIQDMLDTGAMEYINFIAIEWHSRFFTNENEMKIKELELIEQIKNLGVQHENWY